MSDGVSNSGQSFDDVQDAKVLREEDDLSVTDTTSEYTTAPSASSYFTAMGSEQGSSTSLSSTIKGLDDEPDGEDDTESGEKQPSTGSWEEIEQSDTERVPDIDLEKIHDAILNQDIQRLKELSRRPKGFRNDNLRKTIWPMITKTDVFETSPRPDKQAMASHAFYNQVCLDVARSLKRFPPSIQEAQREMLQEELIILIMRVLIKNPSLHYYQGYHDICVTCLMILGEESAFHVVNAVSLSHLQDFMEETMEKTSALLEVVPVILQQEDPVLYDFLSTSGVGSVFSLSWIITWFSHILRRYKTVGRLFDFFLCSNKLMPIYLAASFVLYKKEDILDLDCDMASVFQFLTRFIEEEEDDLPVEVLIQNSQQLMEKYDPQVMVKKGFKRYQSMLPLMRRKDVLSVRLARKVCSMFFGQRSWITISFVGLVASIVYSFYYSDKK